MDNVSLPRKPRASVKPKFTYKDGVFDGVNLVLAVLTVNQIIRRWNAS